MKMTQNVVFNNVLLQMYMYLPPYTSFFPLKGIDGKNSKRSKRMKMIINPSFIGKIYFLCEVIFYYLKHVCKKNHEKIQHLCHFFGVRLY